MGTELFISEFVVKGLYSTPSGGYAVQETGSDGIVTHSRDYGYEVGDKVEVTKCGITWDILEVKVNGVKKDIS